MIFSLSRYDAIFMRIFFGSEFWKLGCFYLDLSNFAFFKLRYNIFRIKYVTIEKLYFFCEELVYFRISIFWNFFFLKSEPFFQKMEIRTEDGRPCRACVSVGDMLKKGREMAEKFKKGNFFKLN